MRKLTGILIDIYQFLFTLLLVFLSGLLCVPMLLCFCSGALLFMTSVGLISLLTRDPEYIGEMTPIMMDLVISPFNKAVEIVSRGKNRGF